MHDGKVVGLGWLGEFRGGWGTVILKISGNYVPAKLSRLYERPYYLVHCCVGTLVASLLLTGWAERVSLGTGLPILRAVGLFGCGGKGASVDDFVSCLVDNVDLKDMCTVVTLNCAVMCKVTGVLGFTRKSIVVINSCMICITIDNVKLGPVLTVLLSVVVYALVNIIVRNITCQPLHGTTSPLTILVATVNIDCLLRGITLLV